MLRDDLVKTLLESRKAISKIDVKLEELDEKLSKREPVLIDLEGKVKKANQKLHKLRLEIKELHRKMNPHFQKAALHKENKNEKRMQDEYKRGNKFRDKAKEKLAQAEKLQKTVDELTKKLQPVKNEIERLRLQRKTKGAEKYMYTQRQYIIKLGIREIDTETIITEARKNGVEPKLPRGRKKKGVDIDIIKQAVKAATA